MKRRHVVLDACVLHPEWLRDLFLRCAEAGLFVFRWTSLILDEVERSLKTDRGLTPDQTTRLMGALRRAFPDGEVVGFERLIAEATNHPKDRHVMAAGMRVAEDEGEATIVTANPRDFKDPPAGVEVSSPDDVLVELIAEDPASIVQIIWSHAQRRTRPPVAVEELLAGLATHVPRFVSQISPLAHIRTDDQIGFIVERLTKARSGSNASEFLVALSDCSLAVPQFAEQMRSLGRRDRRAIADVILRALKTPSTQSVFLGILRSRGVELELDKLLQLTGPELVLLLERGVNRTQ